MDRNFKFPPQAHPPSQSPPLRRVVSPPAGASAGAGADGGASEPSSSPPLVPRQPRKPTVTRLSRDTTTDEEVPHVNANIIAPSSVEVPPPPPVEKENRRVVVDGDETDEEVGETVEVDLR